MPTAIKRGVWKFAARGGAIAALTAATVLAATTHSARAESLSGLYLAARHAEAVSDYQSAGRFYRRALLRAPDRFELMTPALHYTIASGQTGRAPAIAQRLIDVDPSNRFARLTLVTDALRGGDFTAARERLEQAPEDSVTQFVVVLLGAWTAEGLGDHAGADALLDGVVDDGLLSVFAHYHRGLLESLRGDAEKAVAAFAQVRPAGGRLSARLALAQGAALERAGRPEEADALYAEVLSEDANDPTMLAAQARRRRGEAPKLIVKTATEGAAEALHGLGTALSQEDQGGRRLALMYAQLALYLRPDFPAAQLLAGGAFSDLDQKEAAAEMFDGVAPDDPAYAVAQLGRARAFTALDRDEDALRTLDDLIRGGGAAPNVFFAKAEILSSNSRFEECAESYDAGLERLEPVLDRHWLVFFSRGICRERIGLWDGAESDFTRALTMRPDQPDVLNYLGYSLVEQGRRLDEARGMIERAVEVRPESGYIVDSLGWVLYRLGDFEGAVVELERAVALTPVEPVINDHFGDALWMVGRKLEAEFQWRRALSFEPEEKDRGRIERKLSIGLDALLQEEKEQGAADPLPKSPKNADATQDTPQGG